MTMQVLRIQVCCHHNLKPLPPHLVCKLHSNLLRQLRRDVLLLKAQVAMIGLDSIGLIELLLDRDKLRLLHYS